MIPASVNPSVNASTAMTGQLFPFVEPITADVADFSQLFDDMSQMPIMTALSSPELTLSASLSHDITGLGLVSTEQTPEDLLSTLTQGSELALQQRDLSPVLTENQPMSIDSLDTAILKEQGAYLNASQPDQKLDISLSHSPIVSSVSGQSSAVIDNATLVSQIAPKLIITTSDQVGVSSEHTAVQLPVVSDDVDSVIKPEIVKLAKQGDDSLNRVLNTPTLPDSQLSSTLTNPISVQGQRGYEAFVMKENSSQLPQTMTQTSSLLNRASHSVAGQLLAETSHEIMESQETQATLFPASDSESLMLDDFQIIPLVRGNYSSSSLQTAPKLAADVNVGQVLNQQQSPTVPSTVMSKDLAIASDLVSYLGDNRGVVFATSPATALPAASVMQVASSSYDTNSTLVVQLASSTASAMQSAGHSNMSSSHENNKEQARDEKGFNAIADIESLTDEQLTSDDFSLVTSNPLNASSTSSSILGAPLSLRQPQWTQAVAQRVQVMLTQSMKELEVRLDPLGLGPMKISLKLDEHQKAHVTLSAQHGLTRDMLENALPRLKELLAQENIELASATVNSGQEQTDNRRDGDRSSYQGASDFRDDAVNQPIGMTTIRTTDNIVDQYA